MPPNRETLPNAPLPEASTPLMRERGGKRFAFGRFKTEIGSIDIFLCGGRECSRDTPPETKIRKDRIDIVARRRGQKIGYATFYRHGFEAGKRLIDPVCWSSYQTNVEQGSRRLGVASSMYGMMKSCGFEVLPSSIYLEAGSALWQKLDPDCPPPLSPEKLPACTDQSLIARCAKEFEPWWGLKSQLAASKTLKEIAALSPKAARFVSGCSTMPNWPLREIEAVRLLRDAAFPPYCEKSVPTILRMAGFSRSTIWLHTIQSQLGRPSALSALLVARANAVQELNDLDKLALSQFHDLRQEYRRWASSHPISGDPTVDHAPLARAL